MKLLRQLLAGLSVVAMLSGCASSGTRFSRLEDDKFELGNTTHQEIRVQLGTPTSERPDTWNGLELYQISYIFATAGANFDALYDDIVATRMQRFWFREDILYGYQFSSSFKSDNSDFDDDRVAEIRKGVSTRADVISLLGPLTGRFIYPMSLEKAVNV